MAPQQALGMGISLQMETGPKKLQNQVEFNLKVPYRHEKEPCPSPQAWTRFSVYSFQLDWVV